MLYHFSNCHADNHNFLKRNIRGTYIINIPNQVIYRKERVGSIRPSFDFTCKIKIPLRVIRTLR